MKLPFLPIHIETTKTYLWKLKQAKELGKKEEFQANKRQMHNLLVENAKYRIRYGTIR